MNDNDYRELQLSLGLSSQVSSPVNDIQLPSPTTPTAQIEQEVQSARSQMYSSRQRRRQSLRAKLVETPVETVPRSTSTGTPRKPRKRAYEMLQQETANILRSWRSSEPEVGADMGDTSNREASSKAATKSSTNLERKRSRTDSHCIPFFKSWNTLPKSRVEVAMKPKRKSLLAEYEDIDNIGKRSAVQPRKGGHRGRGRREFPVLFPKRPANHIAAKTTIQPKENAESKVKVGIQRVIGGRIGFIGTRRSQRMSIQNTVLTNDTTVYSAKTTQPAQPSLTRSIPRRGRPPGPRKRRGRPPTRGLSSSGRK